MLKLTQKEIKNYVFFGVAKDVTNYDFDHMEKFLHAHDLEKVAYSSWIYGINAGLLRDRSTGELFAVIGRNTALTMAF